DSHLTVGAKVSWKFTPCCCSKPRATIGALNICGPPLIPGFNLNIHLAEIGLTPCGSGTSCQVSFSKMEEYSEAIAFTHLESCRA
ncbi:hypothetical protein M758_UG287300, partial [Ceratodon purpureus]